MPLHKLPYLTTADCFSLLTSLIYIYQPGVDREAVMQWMIDNVFGSPEATRVWGIFTVHKTFEYFMLALFSFLYYMQFPVLERAKVMPHVPWPWNDPDPGVRQEYWMLLKRSLKYILTFHFCVFLFNFFLVPPDQLELVDPKNIPSRHVAAFQIIASAMVAELGFYFAHRLLHTRWMYRFHKMHHEYIDCTVWATMYVSFVDALLTDLIPVGVSIIFFNMHLYVQWMMTLSLLMNAFVVHCGYRFPSNFHPFVWLPLATESEVTHDLHHRYNNVNFGGAYFIWDRLLGTFRDPMVPTDSKLDTPRTRSFTFSSYNKDVDDTNTSGQSKELSSNAGRSENGQNGHSGGNRRKSKKAD